MSKHYSGKHEDEQNQVDEVGRQREWKAKPVLETTISSHVLAAIGG
jgi:hypothetical protein